MPYTAAGKTLMLMQLHRSAKFASLHGGSPTKANELAGGLYQRMPVDFLEPHDGVMKLAAGQVFAVPEGASVTHIGFWTAITGGVLLAHGEVAPKQYKKRGVYVLDGAKLDLNLEVKGR